MVFDISKLDCENGEGEKEDPVRIAPILNNAGTDISHWLKINKSSEVWFDHTVLLQFGEPDGCQNVMSTYGSVASRAFSQNIYFVNVTIRLNFSYPKRFDVVDGKITPKTCVSLSENLKTAFYCPQGEYLHLGKDKP